MLTNKHNAQTTAYYLLLKQKHEEGFHSIADINSKRFDANLLFYANRKKTADGADLHRRGRSSVERFLEQEKRESGGLDRGERKNSLEGHISKRYAVQAPKNRSNIRSRIQQSFDEGYNKSMSK